MTRRRLTIAGLAVLIVLGLVVGAQALPPSSSGFDILYYSDATYQVMVGEREMECEGGVARWGDITPYHNDFSWQCNPNTYTNSMSCTTTRCTDVNYPDGNHWYWDCSTSTSYDNVCWWQMCDEAGHCSGG